MYEMVFGPLSGITFCIFALRVFNKYSLKFFISFHDNELILNIQKKKQNLLQQFLPHNIFNFTCIEIYVQAQLAGVNAL